MITKKCSHYNITEGCQDCETLRNHWYRRINKNDFEDIEQDQTFLRNSSGNNLSENLFPQNIENNIGNSSVRGHFFNIESFLNSENFESDCTLLFSHWNCRLEPRLIKKAVELHCEGLTLREISVKVRANHVTIFRAIKKLTEWIRLMAKEDDNESQLTMVFRPYDETTDKPFIFSSWRDNVFFDIPEETREKLNSDIFYRRQNRKIKKILINPALKVNIACLKENPTQIIGYAIFTDDGGILEFVYVKVKYRGSGIAKLLCKDFIRVRESETKIGQSIIRNHKLTVIKENPCESHVPTSASEMAR